MDLQTTSVSQCLEKKLLIAGFEVPDLLAIFTVLSALNFIFGATHQKLLLVWLPSLALAATLRLGKRGKPDNYLVHWMRFRLSQRYLSAFPEPSYEFAPPTLKKMEVSR